MSRLPRLWRLLKDRKDAINDQIFFWGDTFRIVGVLKNYRQESSKKKFRTIDFSLR